MRETERERERELDKKLEISHRAGALRHYTNDSFALRSSVPPVILFLPSTFSLSLVHFYNRPHVLFYFVFSLATIFASSFSLNRVSSHLNLYFPSSQTLFFLFFIFYSKIHYIVDRDTKDYG